MTPRLDLRVQSHAYVMGNETELYEAVLNVVEKALKYAPESNVSIVVHCDENYVTVAISDRGPGIPGAGQPHVFDRFYRGKEGAHVPGSGLGLTIVKKAAERVGGYVRIRNAPGEGASFELVIPKLQTRPDSARDVVHLTPKPQKSRDASGPRVT